MNLCRYATLATLFLVSGCGDAKPAPEPEPQMSVPGSARTDAARPEPKPTDPQEVIDAKTFKQHLKELSSDAYEGRGPGTPGARKARDYIVQELKAAGAAPGVGDDWFQPVPLRRVETTVESVTVTDGDSSYDLEYGPQFMGNSRRDAGQHIADGELVLVGCGVQAPEYQWDDYKGLDCKGKILVMFVGDPPAADESLFRGPEMTYYGRWTYKYDKALAMGAEGCIVVHKTPWAGYGWEVVANSGRRPKMRVREENAARHLPLEGWVTWDVAKNLVKKTGKSLDELAALAATRDFKPVPLGLRLKSVMTNTSKPFEDINVCGVMKGQDDALSDEWLIYSAHYDHLGMGVPDGDRDVIYNGAIDNASGCAALLAIAKGFGVLEGQHRRSVMFLFVGSEEQGLLGSRYYSEHPIVPIKKTVANINIDGMNVHGKTEDMQVVGFGQSNLDVLMIMELAAEDRRMVPDQEPEKGLYYRSDHFNFARVGIPALYTKSGDDLDTQEHPRGYLRELKDAWTRNDYHNTSDEFDPSWSCEGGAQDARVLFRVGRHILDDDRPPEWNPKSEFRDRR
ncbi:MAG: M28 family peptidase [Planctomycetes bacterium]|nr:M28 family peptidase [Planctomycetota bacterium]